MARAALSILAEKGPDGQGLPWEMPCLSLCLCGLHIPTNPFFFLGVRASWVPFFDIFFILRHSFAAVVTRFRSFLFYLFGGKY